MVESLVLLTSHIHVIHTHIINSVNSGHKMGQRSNSLQRKVETNGATVFINVTSSLSIHVRKEKWVKGRENYFGIHVCLTRKILKGNRQLAVVIEFIV